MGRNSHLGERFALVLSGDVVINVGGERRPLAPGEWLHYAAQPEDTLEVVSPDHAGGALAGRAGDDLNGDGMALAASVGSRLRARRAALGWTLAETAAQADVSVSYLSSIEVGRSVPSLPILARSRRRSASPSTRRCAASVATSSTAGSSTAALPGVERTSSPSLEWSRHARRGPGQRGPEPRAGQRRRAVRLRGRRCTRGGADGTPHMLRRGDSIDAGGARGPLRTACRTRSALVSVSATVPGVLRGR